MAAEASPEQMALAAAGCAPYIETALAAARAIVARQRMAQRREQFKIAPHDKIIQRRRTGGGDIEQQLAHGIWRIVPGIQQVLV